MSSPLASLTTPSFRPPTSGLLDGLDSTFNYTWAGVACFVVFVIYASMRPKGLYDTIPAVGRTGFFTSYLDAIRYIMHGKEFIMEGYSKYQPGVFRVPELNRWHIMVSGPQLTDELRKAPDHVLSFDEAIHEALAVEWTLGSSLATDPYHIPVIRGKLTRNLGRLFSALREEIRLSFEDIIPPTDEWTKVKALDAVMHIVSRTSNRIFVGSPTCRDPEYMELNIHFTIHVAIAGTIINMFPHFLRPITGRLFSNVSKSSGLALKHLRPIIEERQRKIEEYGMDYPDKPIDMLSWLMDEAQGEARTAEDLTRRILALNLAAIHTSSMSFTDALYELASRPEYIEPIREEIEAVVAEEGWTKVAMTRMRKLDSFLKESQRINGLGAITMTRKALKEFTFSDGTHVPKGAFISAVSLPRHVDNNVYPGGLTFKGFRFSDIREEEGQVTKNQMVATSLDCLFFGLGKHTCPGRFFAANELKAMLAHVVLTYDVMMTDKPRASWLMQSRITDNKAEVMFRKRRA